MAAISATAVRRLLLLSLLIVALWPTTSSWAGVPDRTGYVTDQAKILDGPTIDALTHRLGDLQHHTGFEVVVLTVDSLEGYSIEKWGEAVGQYWNIGAGSGQATGAVLIVAPNERKVRIAVGDGLRNHLSDATAAEIISDDILPFFKAQQYGGGIRDGVEAIATVLESDHLPTTVGPVPLPRLTFVQQLTPSGGWWAALLPWAIVFGIYAFGLIFNLAMGGVPYGASWWWYLLPMRSGSGGSSFGGGGGSFGGGATGSW
jgi:uncharacterized protein